MLSIGIVVDFLHDLARSMLMDIMWPISQSHLCISFMFIEIAHVLQVYNEVHEVMQ